MKSNIVKFSQLAEIVAGQSPESKNYSSHEGFPFLQGNRTFGSLYPIIDTYTKKITKIARSGEILMSVRAPVGALNFANTDLCIGRGLAAVRAKNGNNEFLYYNLKYNVQRLIQISSGTTYDSVTKDQLSNFELIVPTGNQKNISNFLMDIDQKIELNNKINSELESMAKLIYDYWFVQFDYPDENGNPYKSSGGKMVYNEELQREIPEGWQSGELKDLAILYRGVTYNKFDILDSTKPNSIPILRATNITKNSIDNDNMVFVSSHLVDKNQRLSKYDILITMSSGSKEHIGKNGFYYFENKVGFGAFCSRIVSKTPISRFYLGIFMQSNFTKELIRKQCLGTNINNLNNSIVNSFPLPIPPNSVLSDFHNSVSSIFERIGNNYKENVELVKLRDWLLPVLMNGQVTIKD